MARACKPGETTSPPTKRTGLNALDLLRGRTSVLSATSKWIASFRAEVPTGYEDDTGFHYGPPPAEDQSNMRAQS